MTGVDCYLHSCCVVNATFLVSAKTEVIIPVSCVEQGRWHHDSEAFESGNIMMHASVRRRHQTDVKFSLKQGRGYRSNQGRVWEDISGKLDRMKISAPTAAMADAYESYERKLSDFLKAFGLIEWQVGAIFALNGWILGIECLDAVIPLPNWMKQWMLFRATNIKFFFGRFAIY